MFVYVLRRIDTSNFHGWAIFECFDYMDEIYFSSTSLEECKEVMHDLGAK